MERSGYKIVGDVRHQKHEDGDFPTVCESCLGDNPFVRMIRETSGKECKICARPYTSFRWKPGPQARYKQTIICQSCSRLKNVCQTCLFDLEYGLPVQVRDKYLEEQQKIELPNSYVNRNYLANQLDKLCEDLPYGKSPIAHEGLMKLARIQPYYQRNLPRVCSFWLKGTCNRGSECPFLHREENHDPSLANQNIRNRFTGSDDPVAEKIFKKAQESTEKLNNISEDKSITTIYVGNLNNKIEESLIRSHFRPFGDIKSIKMIPKQNCAFVTYSYRESAENAMKALCDNLVIKNESLKLLWSKSNKSQIRSEHTDIYDSLQNLNSSYTDSSYPSSSRIENNFSFNQNSKVHPSTSTLIYASMNPSEAEHRK